MGQQQVDLTNYATLDDLKKIQLTPGPTGPAGKDASADLWSADGTFLKTNLTIPNGKVSATGGFFKGDKEMISADALAPYAKTADVIKKESNIQLNSSNVYTTGTINVSGKPLISADALAPYAKTAEVMKPGMENYLGQTTSFRGLLRVDGKISQASGHNVEIDAPNKEGGRVTIASDGNVRIFNGVQIGSDDLKDAGWNHGLNIRNADGSWTHFNSGGTSKNFIRGDTEITNNLTVKGKLYNSSGQIGSDDLKDAGWNHGLNIRNADGSWTHFNSGGTSKNFIRGDTEITNNLTVKGKLYNSSGQEMGLKGDTGTVSGNSGLVTTKGGASISGWSEDNLLTDDRFKNSINIRNQTGDWTHFSLPNDSPFRNYIRGKTSVEGGGLVITSPGNAGDGDGLSDEHRYHGLNIRNKDSSWSHFNEAGKGTNTIRGKTTVEGDLCINNNGHTVCLSPTGEGTLIIWKGDLKNRKVLEFGNSANKIAWGGAIS